MPVQIPGKTAEALRCAYGVIAEWLLYPEEIDPHTLEDDAVGSAEAAARRIDPRAAECLSHFHKQRETIKLEDYLNLLELNPRCPLYLGSYQFAEPSTCSAAGVSERNQYMLEINNIYRHFGFRVAGELPDYLPAMVEFLSLSIGRDRADDELRLRFIEKLVLPGARLFAGRLEAEGSLYRHLAEALVICLEWETGAEENISNEGTGTRGTGAKGTGTVELPVQIKEAAQIG